MAATNPDPGTSIEPKLDQLRARLRDLDSVLVCYSGGVDSAFVLAVAHQELGPRAVGMTAVSPSLAPSEKEEAASIARLIGADHRLVESHEIDDPSYVANNPDRCFHCKSELYRIAVYKQREWGIAAIVNGTNVDDLGDYRPGLDAAREAGVLSPLVELGFTKADVRAGASAVGLPIWDKPAAACLSSRIPYGTSVTRERLARIGGFEADLRTLGFRQVRVRFHDDLARIELDLADLTRAAGTEMRAEIVAAGKRHGFRYVTLDLGGYRTGSHNEVLVGRALRVVS
ncbi:ATP-dependent sacrificial sulfur transferase LarE [Chondromyces apiculatus]|uniref:GMP synthase glutamine-hydrolyzing protein n=1 Tax=Chondromyces apiculatus DSM 436 TaxID=1192034 RepID=A0A017TIL2_9BACT|nr:ATP-dependent sacrificial sulfur transferase LarE [Chondromyces apiculatus]EYF08742.1 GMP synthase glutamine-hydrolyzing protein [Chondromyces apiculatus DSM 436]